MASDILSAGAIYDALKRPPAWALKEIKAGDLKGKTDINPQWRYEAMTKAFGLVGLGWKYSIDKLWREDGANGEIFCFAQVGVFIRDQESWEWSDPIIGIGGSKLVNNFSNGLKSNDEGYKMAITDAFSTALKMLGVAADIYAGKWDGSKYVDHEENAPKAAPEPEASEATKKKADEKVELAQALADDGYIPQSSMDNIKKAKKSLKTEAEYQAFLKKIQANIDTGEAKKAASFKDDDIPFDK